MSKLIVTASKGKTVNMRQNPTITAKVLQAIPLTTEVDLLEKTNSEWYKIKYKGVEGYMKAEFLKAKGISQSDLRSVYESLSETLTLIEKILK